MKQVEVFILGQVYMLGCPEGGETLLRQAVAAVDQEMSVIRDAGKVKARERIAVLAALNLAYQLAERGSADTAPVDAHNRASVEPAPEGPAAASEIEALVRRIDDALSEDGQLL